MRREVEEVEGFVSLARELDKQEVYLLGARARGLSALSRSSTAL